MRRNDEEPAKSLAGASSLLHKAGLPAKEAEKMKRIIAGSLAVVAIGAGSLAYLASDGDSTTNQVEGVIADQLPVKLAGGKQSLAGMNEVSVDCAPQGVLTGNYKCVAKDDWGLRYLVRARVTDDGSITWYCEVIGAFGFGKVE